MKWAKISSKASPKDRLTATYESVHGSQKFRAFGKRNEGWTLVVFTSNAEPRIIEGMNTLGMCKRQAIRITCA